MNKFKLLNTITPAATIGSFMLTFLGIVVLLYIMIHQLSGLLVAAGLAYLFLPLVQYLSRFKISDSMGIGLVMALIIGMTIFLITVPLPFIGEQLLSFIQSLPDILASAQAKFSDIPQHFPDYINSNQMEHLTEQVQSWVTSASTSGLSFFMVLIPSILSLIMYLFLVPLLVFFFLKDNHVIKTWCSALLPNERTLIIKFFKRIDHQLGHYIRGKLTELAIVTAASWTLFIIMGLKYSLVLGLIVGLSVFIPMIGGIIATVPVLLVAYWQWGLGDIFYILCVCHLLLLLLDGNVLVPILFSQKLNLHPAAVIISILYFGNIWGFWGVFFAIPLATILDMLLELWRTGNIKC